MILVLSKHIIELFEDMPLEKNQCLKLCLDWNCLSILVFEFKFIWRISLSNFALYYH